MKLELPTPTGGVRTVGYGEGLVTRLIADPANAPAMVLVDDPPHLVAARKKAALIALATLQLLKGDRVVREIIALSATAAWNAPALFVETDGHRVASVRLVPHENADPERVKFADRMLQQAHQFIGFDSGQIPVGVWPSAKRAAKTAPGLIEAGAGLRGLYKAERTGAPTRTEKGGYAVELTNTKGTRRIAGVINPAALPPPLADYGQAAQYIADRIAAGGPLATGYELRLAAALLHLIVCASKGQNNALRIENVGLFATELDINVHQLIKATGLVTPGWDGIHREHYDALERALDALAVVFYEPFAHETPARVVKDHSGRDLAARMMRAPERLRDQLSVVVAVDSTFYYIAQDKARGGDGERRVQEVLWIPPAAVNPVHPGRVGSGVDAGDLLSRAIACVESHYAECYASDTAELDFYYLARLHGWTKDDVRRKARRLKDLDRLCASLNANGYEAAVKNNDPRGGLRGAYIEVKRGPRPYPEPKPKAPHKAAAPPKRRKKAAPKWGKPT